jgi:hypothetical protein
MCALGDQNRRKPALRATEERLQNFRRSQDAPRQGIAGALAAPSAEVCGGLLLHRPTVRVAIAGRSSARLNLGSGVIAISRE